jgi:hypothetical protein
MQHATSPRTCRLCSATSIALCTNFPLAVLNSPGSGASAAAAPKQWWGPLTMSPQNPNASTLRPTSRPDL